jgi:hypothetical protein
VPPRGEAVAARRDPERGREDSTHPGWAPTRHGACWRARDRFLGRFFVPRLLDRKHYLLTEVLGEGRTRLADGERFSGLPVPVFRKPSQIY